MIEDFNKFVECSKRYNKNYKEEVKLRDQIRDFVDGYSISVWKKYLFEVRKKEGDMTTSDLKRLEEILGCPFDFGGKGFAKFIIKEGSNEKGAYLIKKYKKVLEEGKILAGDIVRLSDTDYPSAYICGKRRMLQTFSHTSWGFRVREMEKELSLQDIIDIEKETGSVFVERNTYGCDFSFNVEE